MIGHGLKMTNAPMGFMMATSSGSYQGMAPAAEVVDEIVWHPGTGTFACVAEPTNIADLLNKKDACSFIA